MSESSTLQEGGSSSNLNYNGSTFQDYQMFKAIGEGAFATVRLGVHLPTKTKVAIKIIPRNNFQDPDHIKRFEREVNLIKAIDHPFVAEFFELLEDDQNFYIIMEFVANGNMLDYVNDNGELNENSARKYFIQLVSILEYLHEEMHIAHRDLKAENVLLDRNGNIRVIDFGLSNRFSKDNPFLSTACGSPAYASPEMIKGQEYTTASDIWSAGILLYAMVMGELPYDDENMQRLLQKIVYTQPKFPLPISRSLLDLLEKLLEKDPSKRITLNKIKEHPWFSKTEYASLCSSDYRLSRQLIVSPINNESPIDREIIAKMMSLGYDCQELQSSLLAKETTKLTAVYRMLRKEKITDLLMNIGNSGGSLLSPRNAGTAYPLRQSQTLLNRPNKHTIPYPLGSSNVSAQTMIAATAAANAAATASLRVNSQNSGRIDGRMDIDNVKRNLTSFLNDEEPISQPNGNDQQMIMQLQQQQQQYLQQQQQQYLQQQQQYLQQQQQMIVQQQLQQQPQIPTKQLIVQPALTSMHRPSAKTPSSLACQGKANVLRGSSKFAKPFVPQQVMRRRSMTERPSIP